MDSFSTDPNFFPIVITGGPCAGKTTFMAVARQYLEDRGMRVAVQPEVATEFITSGFSPTHGWRNGLDFQFFLLDYMLRREEMYYRMLKAQNTSKPLVLFCDRGALDAIAYIGRTNFLQLTEKMRIDLHALRERYRAVIHLITAADGAKEHYTHENNSARSEGLEEARELDGRTRDAWVGHSHHFIIDNSTDFDGKINRTLVSLTRILKMPVPKEKERKFLIKNWNRSMLPSNVVSVEIIQTYLTPDEQGRERRVRMRTLDGSSSYYYTKKLDTDMVGVREEQEEQITHRRYEELLLERDPTTVPIVKTRHMLPYDNRIIEIDEFNSWMSGLVLAEVEVSDMSEPINLPPELAYEEVTGIKKYKNRSIAESLFS